MDTHLNRSTTYVPPFQVSGQSNMISKEQYYAEHNIPFEIFNTKSLPDILAPQKNSSSELAANPFQNQ